MDVRTQRNAGLLVAEAMRLLTRDEAEAGVLGPPDGCSIGRLVLSMARREGAGGMRHAMGDPMDRDRDAAAGEWQRAFACNALLDVQDRYGTLTKADGFRSRGQNQGSAIIDWQWLRYEGARAMGTTPGSKGGFALSSQALPVTDPLWGDSIVGALGVPVIEGLMSAMPIPRGEDVDLYWQTGEGAAPPANVDPLIGAVSVAPRTVIGIVKVSAQLVRQAPSAADYVSRLLLGAFRRAVARALLQGLGGAQPLGLANLPGGAGTMDAVSGAALTWAKVLEAQRRLVDNGARDSGLNWVGPATVRELLGTRQRFTGSDATLWNVDNDSIAGAPAVATSDAPAAALFCGDWSKALTALFGPGVEIAIDRSGGFDDASLRFRLMAMVDVAFTQPAAFGRITSVS